MIRTLAISICSVALCVVGLCGEVPRDVVRFVVAEHDFGTIAEDGGAVEHTFRFRNVSDRPVVILGTTTSCGCTTASFSRQPVMPDAEGSIVVRFAPMNYPGRFARKVVVTTSEGVASQQLLVQGYVTPRQRTVEEEFPVVLGAGLRAEVSAHAFGYVEHGKPQRTTIGLYNGSARAVSLRLVSRRTSGLLECHAPRRVAAGARAAINVGYSLPVGCGKYGTMQDIVAVEVDGKMSDYSLIISGIAIDPRDEFADTEEPRAELSDNFIKFGRVNQDSRGLRRTLLLRNVGVSALEVRSIEGDDALFVAEVEGSRTLAAGERCSIVVRLTPAANLLGPVSGRLRVVTNDPRHPMRSIRVSAIIER